ncbi:MAG: RHS repeat-associated core domain-containing protein [Candidatus Acidiferrales bacterium]
MSVTNYTSAVIYAPDGTEAFPTHQDTNGNSYSTTAPNFDIVDQLGRTPVTTVTNCNGHSNQVCYNVLNSQGSTSTYTVTTESIAVSTNFGQSGATEYSGNITAVQSIQLPDGTSYQFGYDSGSTAGHYGELTSVTLPTSGQITYSYTKFTDAAGNANEWLNTYVAGGGTWKFTPSTCGSCPSGFSGCQQVTGLKPSGDNVVYTFGLNNGAWKSQAQYYTGSVSSANLVKAVAVTWNTSNSCQPSCPGSQDIQKMSETTTLPSTGTTSVNRTIQYTYDSVSDSNVTKISEWKFYTGSLPSAPDRVTSISYNTSSNYTSKNIINLPTTITVTNGAGTTQYKQTKIAYDSTALTSVTGTSQHDDANFGTGNTIRGNPTLIQGWISGSSYLNTTLTYDTTGQVRSVQDPNGNTTSFSYTDSLFSDNGANPPQAYTPSKPTNAYLTTVTPPLIGSATFGYYFGSGKQASSKDQNGQITYAHFQDPLDRPTTTFFPDGGWALKRYFSSTLYDTFRSITDTSPSPSCSGCRFDRITLDNLGRLYASTLESDPEGYESIVTYYDSDSRVQQVSNPYRSPSDPTYGLTMYSYDGLDRVTKVTDADGSHTQAYYGAAVTSSVGGITAQLCSSSTYGLGYPAFFIDEAGKKRETWTDGFGRLIEVDEPNSSGNLTQNTCNTYDLLNNLTQALQSGSRQRTFAYDTLSRLTSSATPEAGTTTLFYTTSSGALCSGNPAAVCRRTDARSITTTYSYDALNRLTSKVYSDSTPAEIYIYDVSSTDGATISNPKGRLVKAAISSVGVATISSFDAVGRVVHQYQCKPPSCTGTWAGLSYTYNLGGGLTSYNDDSRFTITQAFDTAGRVTSLSSSFVDANHPATLATVSKYWPSGAPELSTYGNNLSELRFLNNRFQLCRININTSTPTLQHCSDDVASGTVQDFYLNYNEGAADDGNLALWSASDGQTFHRTYTYDPLNRLLTLSDSASGQACKGLQWTYDVWGNRSDQTTTSGICGESHLSFDANNHITTSGFSYDAAGNLTHDASHSYIYDAENRLTQVDGGSTATYIYDALGRRVRKVVGSTTIDYVYDPGGHVVLDALPNGFWTTGYVYLNGQLTAQYSGANTGTTYFVHQDHLGSTRVLTATNGSVYDSLDYLPFGEQTAGGSGSSHKFTGYERDAETGVDYAMARHMSSNLGRFLSTDPLGGDLGGPQSLNRYAYVGNNPANFTDPSGLVRNDQVYCDPWFPCAGFAGTEGGGSLSLVWGNDIFDAIAGAPGTYMAVDMYGNKSWGFSLDLYEFVAGQGGLGVSGWTYVTRDLGSETIASGFLADKIASAEQANWLNANFPGSVDEIRSYINTAVGALLNGGANPDNVVAGMPATIGAVVFGYAQQHGLDEYWEQVFYNYFVNLGPAFPPQ